ncbi:preprotein translocase subunit SecG [Sphingomonas nostoxanthinifaciens]|uniref:preprotein translocase subunit SecG n=1 Tax=Sphingomonas nostoxanthinifaciens TaxID=2872652 RepID=UPI001CC1CA61|nr:preprotein translocase subunit SecG [Sphingomonas nostoxanthinifaciens]UAK26384.1 preprotein translocase subunit SecG [Sphingomonas nostoxanthinifaciens]
MLTFLLVIHALVAAALVAVILMQRSEGGGLASGGNPAGLMSARGAADFLTRTTSILASVFVVLSIGLAALATMQHSPATIDTSLVKSRSAAPAPAPKPTNGIPLAH